LDDELEKTWENDLLNGLNGSNDMLTVSSNLGGGMIVSNVH
jgi:hypothetical protein